MSYFLKKTFVFISIFLITFLITTFFLVIFNYPDVDLPAPNFSNSYSLNEKIKFVKEHKESLPPEVISIGSSMSLNNLHSETIVKYLDTEKYINLSSWGLNIQENYHLLKSFVEIYKPKAVITAFNLIDFQKSDKTIRYDFIKEYLLSDYNFPHYLRSFNMQYYFKNISYSKRVRTLEDQYEYLGFDNYGAVNYNENVLKIRTDRWKGEDILKYRIDTAQYQFLDSISLYCQNQNIELYFFHGAFREGYLSHQNEKEQDLIKFHLEKLKETLSDNDCDYISSVDTIWNDNLFVDWTHLNSNGARLFTEYCFKKTKKNNFTSRRLSQLN